MERYDDDCGAGHPHECPAELSAGEAHESDDECRAAHQGRPSTAPQPDRDASQTWGRLGHLTVAQDAHLASMRRKLPQSTDEEARASVIRRGSQAPSETR